MKPDPSDSTAKGFPASGAESTPHPDKILAPAPAGVSTSTSTSTSPVTASRPTSDRSTSRVVSPVVRSGQPSNPRRRLGRPSRRVALVAGGVVPAILVAACAAGVGAYSTWRASDVIAPGVTVAGIPVGGLSRTRAEDAVQGQLDHVSISLHFPDRIETRTISEMGGQVGLDEALSTAYSIGREGGTAANFFRVYDMGAAGDAIVPRVQWNKPRLLHVLKEFAREEKKKPRDARFTIADAGVVVVPEVAGQALNIGSSAAAVEACNLSHRDADMAIEPLAPAVTSASLAGTDVLLVSYRTHFNPGERGRSVNVRTAARAINGQVVMPGHIFSFNRTTGERTAAKGYKMAKIFLKQPGDDEAEIVDGLAGGTCQVSSTLYNAVLKLAGKTDGGVKVTQRTEHSLPVKYVPPGRDATVAWPYTDLRFKNKLPEPVYLRTQVKGPYLTVGIWARVPNGMASPVQAVASTGPVSTTTAG